MQPMVTHRHRLSFKDLYDKGIIRESVYKNFAKSNQDIKNEAKVDEFTKQLGALDQGNPAGQCALQHHQC